LAVGHCDFPRRAGQTFTKGAISLIFSHNEEKTRTARDDQNDRKSLRQFLIAEPNQRSSKCLPSSRHECYLCPDCALRSENPQSALRTPQCSRVISRQKSLISRISRQIPFGSFSSAVPVSRHPKRRLVPRMRRFLPNPAARSSKSLPRRKAICLITGAYLRSCGPRSEVDPSPRVPRSYSRYRGAVSNRLAPASK
jgi:hypothetical protein